MKAIGQVDKAIAVAPAAERSHLDSATSRRGPLESGVRVSGIWRSESASGIHQHGSEDAGQETRPPPNGGRPMVVEVGPYRKTEIPRSGE
jgi:hypothetical protein